MKSIRIKVKYLLLILVLMGIVLTFSSELLFLGIEAYNNIAKEPINLQRISFDSVTNENKRLDLILTEHTHNLVSFVVIGDGMMMGGPRVRYQDGYRIKATFDTFLEDENLYKTRIDYTLNVILSQWFSGHTEVAESMLDTLNIEDMTLAQKDHYYLILASLELAYFDLDQANEFVGLVSDNYSDAKQIIYNFMNQAYGYDSSNEVVDPSDKRYTQYFINLQHMVDYATWETFTLRDDTVTGQVTVNGKGLAGALIYPSYRNGMSSHEGLNAISTFIDHDGKYELKLNKDRLESINIAVPWQRIHDMQRVQTWKQDFDQDIDFAFTDGCRFEYAYIEEGKFYYKIKDGKEDTAYIMKVEYFEPDFYNDQSNFYLDSHEGVIDMSDIKKEMTFVFNNVSSSDTLDMNRFYEHFYLSGQYALTVKEDLQDYKAYISNGFISESLSTIITYDEGLSPNQGDRLMIEDKYEEAMAWYAENPSPHNLYVLYQLYLNGYIPHDGEWDQYLEGQDYDQALKYLRQLIDLDGPTDQRLYYLSDIYELLEMYDEREDVLLDKQALNPSVYTELELAYNAISRGAYLDGIDQLKRFDVDQLGDRYLEYFLLIDEREGLPEELLGYLKDIDTSEFDQVKDKIKSGQYQSAYMLLADYETSPMKAYFELLILRNLTIEDKPYQEGMDKFKQFDDQHDYMEQLANQIKGDLWSIMKYVRPHSSLF